MDADEALLIIEKALSEEHLNKLQISIFRDAWDDLSYQETAQKTGYELGYIKQTGSHLWQLLSKALGTKVSKSNVQQVLKRYLSQNFEKAISYTSSPEFSPPTPSPYSLPPALFDWGEASDVSIFYGRTEELEILARWVVQDRCRLVGLFGMGGIGKTALSVKLAKQLSERGLGEGNEAASDPFTYVIWRSLRNAPPIQDLLADWIKFLSHQQETVLPTSLDQQILRLLDYLRTHRCLLILDNAETIMQAGSSDGSYQPGYEGYGQLLRCVAETPHQSCLLLTSREKPKGFAPREGESLPVRSLQVTGLATLIGQELFRVKGQFSGSSEEWQTLISHYAGNPLALKIVATAIADFFDGSVTRFLEFSRQGGFVFGDIRDLLERQIGRLSKLEQDVMLWLAINREPTSFAELRSDFLTPVTPAHLLETLTALERRSLIEKNRTLFTLQPAVMEYLTELLIEQVCEEVERESGVEVDDSTGEARESDFSRSQKSGVGVTDASTSYLHSHALIKATAKDHIRETQIRLILQPIIDRLNARASSTELDKQLTKRLDGFRGKSIQETGYSCGNLINLLRQLQADQSDRTCDLSHRDFSHLAIGQAYLCQTVLHHTNLTGSELAKSIFTETFSQILAVAFSPDGQLLAASDISYDVHIWRVADGKKWLTCQSGDGWVWAIAFSPNSRLLASSANGTIHFWDTQTGACLRTLRGYASRIFSLAFSPDGQYLVGGYEDHQIRIWQVATGNLVTVISGHTDEVRSVAFSPDGCLLASGSYDKTIKLWEIGDLEEESIVRCRTTLAGHENWVWSVAFSPNGRMLASGSSDRTIKLWDVETSTCFRTLTGHAQAVRSVAFAPYCLDSTPQTADVEPESRSEGRDFWIASGSDDRTVRLWRMDGQCLRVLQGHTSWISAVAVSPNGAAIASGSEDQSVRLWDSQTDHCLKVVQGYSSGIWSIAFNPANNMLVSGGQDRQVRLWNLFNPDGADNPDESDPNGRELPSDKSSGANEEGSGALFDTPILTIPGQANWIWSVAVTPDGSIIASSSEDGIIHLWKNIPNSLTHSPHYQSSNSLSLKGHTDAVWSVAFSPDGAILASGSLDSTVRLWEPTTGNCWQTLQAHSSGVWSVAFAPQMSLAQPDHYLLASGSQDQTIQLWEISQDSAQTAIRCVRTLTGHTNWIRCVAFSPDGQFLVSGSSDGMVKLWQVDTGECIQTFQAYESLVLAVAYSPDGSTIATGGGDGSLKLWKIFPPESSQPIPTQSLPQVNIKSSQTFSPLRILQGHQKWVRSLSYSPDGKILASCSQDGTIRLWDCLTGECLKLLRVPRPYENVNITGIRGLTEAQKESLKALGAIDFAK